MTNINTQAKKLIDKPVENGSIVEVCGRRLHVRFLEDELVLHDLVSHTERLCTIEDLNEMIDSGGAYIEQPGAAVKSPVPAHFDPNNAYLISDIPNSLKSAAGVAVWLEKIKWLKRISDRGYKRFQNDNLLIMIIKEIEHEYMETCGFKSSTLYKAHLQVRKQGGDFRCIFPQFTNRGGGGKKRLDEKIEEVINRVLEIARKPEFGLIRPARIYPLIEGSILQLQRAEPNERYTIPSLQTITRRINEHFSAYEIEVRKYGKKQADKKFRQDGMRIRAARPLDVVEFDDKDTGCFLIDDSTGLPWGRAHLTAGIDQATFSILGMHISEFPRSQHSAWAAFENAIYPKDPAHSDFANCLQRWEPYGHIGTVLLDNASYNSTLDFQASVLEYGAEIEFSKPHHPTNKSDIEHFNHMLMDDFVTNIPGWVGEKGDRGALNFAMDKAIFSITEFKRAFNAWVTDDYSNKIKTAIGKSPREAWAESFSEMPPYLPRKMPQISLAGTVRQTLRPRDSGGMLRKALRYQSDELRELTKVVGKRNDYVIRYHPYDLSFILVHDPRSGHYARVPCIEQPWKYLNITDHQQSMIMKYSLMLRKEGDKSIDLYNGRMRLIEYTSQNMYSKSMRKRKQVFRMGNIVKPEEIDYALFEEVRSKMLNIENFVTDILSNEIPEDEFEIEFDN
jgi:putative transposase